MATFKERFNTLFEESELSQEEFGKKLNASKGQVYKNPLGVFCVVEPKIEKAARDRKAAYCLCLFGGDEGNRTPDLLNAN